MAYNVDWNKATLNQLQASHTVSSNFKGQFTADLRLEFY